MQRAGTVKRIAGSILVARSDDEVVPDIGAQTIDEQLDPVGRIVDVFGPVDRPYLAIAPAEGRAPASVLGESVYVREDRSS